LLNILEIIKFEIITLEGIPMLAKRIIPCLDCDLNVPHGRVVKGWNLNRSAMLGNLWSWPLVIMRMGLMR